MLPEPCVWVDVEPTIKTGYVDLNHLRQCLDLYYRNALNDVDLSRLWMRCEELTPGNPLAGRLDQDTLRRCLFALPEQYRTAIAHYYDPTCPELLETLFHGYNHGLANAQTVFADYLQEAYCDALLLLSEVVWRAL